VWGFRVRARVYILIEDMFLPHNRRMFVQVSSHFAQQVASRCCMPLSSRWEERRQALRYTGNKASAAAQNIAEFGETLCRPKLN